MDKGKLYQGNSRGNSNLIVLAEPAGMIEPSKGAPNYPPPRELLPCVGLALFRNVCPKG